MSFWPREKEETSEKHVGECQDEHGAATTTAAAAADTAAGADASLTPCAWWREKCPLAPDSYTFLHYFTYCFYAPLHFAGPTITFNSFVSVRHAAFHRKRCIHSIAASLCRVTSAGALPLPRSVAPRVPCVLSHCSFCILQGRRIPHTQCWLYSMSVLLRSRCYLVEVRQYMAILSLVGTPRRGASPPENMTTCVSNNYSVQGFWRGWHRSFNRWLVRYVYIPLGGGVATYSSTASPTLTRRLFAVSRQVLNVFLTFTFVALLARSLSSTVSMGLGNRAAVPSGDCRLCVPTDEDGGRR